MFNSNDNDNRRESLPPPPVENKDRANEGSILHLIGEMLPLDGKIKLADMLLNRLINSDTIPGYKKLYPIAMKANRVFLDTTQIFFDEYAEKDAEKYTDEEIEKLHKCAALFNDFTQRFKEEILNN